MQAIRVVTSSNVQRFEESVNKLLYEGWAIQSNDMQVVSTGEFTGKFNSGVLIYKTVYTAILIKEIENDLENTVEIEEIQKILEWLDEQAEEKKSLENIINGENIFNATFGPTVIKKYEIYQLIHELLSDLLQREVG